MNHNYENATGAIDFTLTNDYMFHVLLQKNEQALRGLCSAMLHLDPEQLKHVEIRNPIEIGASVEDKTFVLDVFLILNDNMRLDLEMQVLDYHDWPERSLSYLCRSFDQLSAGQEYTEAMPAIHIGFLDFDLFPDEPEFYARNFLMNVKTHKIFTTKFQLNVLCLRQVELATEEDRLWQIDRWAKLFKAKTWEEIKMVAENNPTMESVGETLYDMNSDFIMRAKAWAREDYERRERSNKRKMEELNAAVAEKKAELAEKKVELAAKEAELTEKKTELAKTEAALAERDATLAEKDTALAERDATLAEKDTALAERDAALAEKDATLAEKDATLAEQSAVIAALREELKHYKDQSI